ncbi:MAG: HAMP domain-containing sensor histidine kinase [Gemmatimonadales bacterium]
MKSSSRYLILLLGLTLALAGLLAFEAQRATSSHRVTAERALRDYATVAAWEFLSAAEEQVDRSLAPALGPVTGTPAASPYDSLPSPAVLASTSDTVLRCGSDRLYFALDFRTGTLSTAGSMRARSEAAWLRDPLLEPARRTESQGGRFGTLWRGEGAAGQVAFFGIKSLRYSGYALHDAPLAAYGFVTCPAALTPIFGSVFARHPLLPRSVTGGGRNADLVRLEVTDPGGRVLYRAGADAGPGSYAGDAASAGSGSFMVRAWLPAAVAGRLVLTHPASRLPVLLGLLALTAGLAAVGTRQLRREQELTRLRSDFTSSVSHELRTPLTQILLFAETLEMGRARGEDARREALGIIVQEARRLVHLVENVLHFSRAERQMVRVRKQTIRLAPVVREVVERFAPLAGSSAVRLRTELDELLVAPVDPECLHQVLLNLLDNAVKHGGPSGPVTVRAALHRGYARLEVEDTGPGVAAADGERIWEPFVRLGGSEAVAGSGIGLAVVRHLVDAHGGLCRTEAAAGSGARFVVEFPGGFQAGEADLAGVPLPLEAPWRAS